MSRTIESSPRNTSEQIRTDLVQLARLALAGRPQDVEAYIQRLVRRYRPTDSEVADSLRDLLRSGAVAGAPLRSATSPAPVDVDSRMTLLRSDMTGAPQFAPILQAAAMDGLVQLRDERRGADRLEEAGLLPSRTALFTGPPGVGKTLSARWLAAELDLPLLVLDLSAVMSSMLGRTGSNLRRVLDYAKQQPSVLLLDELDAVAKKRNDSTEVGELKRLVTVLIQEIDDWPTTSLLLAATNHAELLDPAIWRRFDHVIPFGLPGQVELVSAIERFLLPSTIERSLVDSLAIAMDGASFSDVERVINAARRKSAITQSELSEELLAFVQRHVEDLPAHERRRLAVTLSQQKSISQRRASEITGVSRDTIRSYAKSVREGEGTENG
ncbi:AAA family ATPase [Rhodococcus sp. KBS0724]|nr:AAA family ATPase [Rhodococcus sp. KBS0724]